MTDQAVPASAAGTFDVLDDAGLSRFQWKIMFVSGMGFFTDAYDLFSRRTTRSCWSAA